MALNKEDKSDVKNAMGKALANKVSKVTKDKKKEIVFGRGIKAANDKSWAAALKRFNEN